MHQSTGATEKFNMPGTAGAWGETTGDEDRLGLAPVYRGPCVTKTLALDPGGKRKWRFLIWEASRAGPLLARQDGDQEKLGW